MSTIAASGDLWVTAGWIKARLHVNESKMLRLVSIGRVNVRILDGRDPLYSAGDVIAWCKEDGRDVSMPDIIDRRQVTARRTAAAK